MPLSDWGSVAQGISGGLNNALKIQSMQQTKKASERADVVAGQQDTTFAQQQDEYKRLNEPVGTVDSFVGQFGLLKDDHTEALNKVSRLTGLKPGDTMRRKDQMAVDQHLEKDPATTQWVIDAKRKALEDGIAKTGEELKTAPDKLAKTGELSVLNEKLKRLNAADPRVQATEKTRQAQEKIDIEREKAKNAKTEWDTRYRAGQGDPAAIKAINDHDEREREKEYSALEKSLAVADRTGGRAADRQAATEERKARADQVSLVRKGYDEKYKEIQASMKELASDDPDTNFERAKLHAQQIKLRTSEKAEIDALNRGAGGAVTGEAGATPRAGASKEAAPKKSYSSLWNPQSAGEAAAKETPPAKPTARPISTPLKPAPTLSAADQARGVETSEGLQRLSGVGAAIKSGLGAYNRAAGFPTRMILESKDAKKAAIEADAEMLKKQGKTLAEINDFLTRKYGRNY